jgi:ribokinase
MSARRPKITVAGSANIDFAMKMAHLPRAGETVTDAVFLQTYGGKGANQAIAAARAGGDVWFVACVGRESLADEMVDGFRRDGIHTDFVFREEGCASGTALIMSGEAGQNYLSVAPGANYRLGSPRIDAAAAAFEGSAMVLVQNEIPRATLVRAIAEAAARGVPVMLNLAPVRERDPELLRAAQVLVVNEGEAGLLTGIEPSNAEQAAEAADQLRRMGPAAVVITLGPGGCWVSSHDLRGLLPAFPVDVVDTTGAGDTFCGALAVSLAEGQPLSGALRFASAAAALSVTVLGAQPSIPGRARIESFLRERGL